MRTTISRLLYFFFFVEKIAFVHVLCTLTFTQFTQVSKAVNPRFVTVAPAKVERITPDDADVPDFNSLRNTLRLQHSFARPFVDALSARTSASQIGGSVAATPVIRPRDAYREIVFVFDFSWLNCRPAWFHWQISSAFHLFNYEIRPLSRRQQRPRQSVRRSKP